MRNTRLWSVRQTGGYLLSDTINTLMRNPTKTVVSAAIPILATQYGPELWEKVESLTWDEITNNANIAQNINYGVGGTAAIVSLAAEYIALVRLCKQIKTVFQNGERFYLFCEFCRTQKPLLNNLKQKIEDAVTHEETIDTIITFLVDNNSTHLDHCLGVLTWRRSVIDINISDDVREILQSQVFSNGIKILNKISSMIPESERQDIFDNIKNEPTLYRMLHDPESFNHPNEPDHSDNRVYNEGILVEPNLTEKAREFIAKGREMKDRRSWTCVNKRASSLGPVGRVGEFLSSVHLSREAATPVESRVEETPSDEVMVPIGRLYSSHENLEEEQRSQCSVTSSIAEEGSHNERHQTGNMFVGAKGEEYAGPQWTERTGQKGDNLCCRGLC